MRTTIQTAGFRPSVDDRLDNVTALDGVGYGELANAVLTATRVGSFFAPKYNRTVRYAEVTVNGALFGIGFTVTGDTVLVHNVLTAGMVRWNRTEAHVTVKTVTSLGA